MSGVGAGVCCANAAPHSRTAEKIAAKQLRIISPSILYGRAGNLQHRCLLRAGGRPRSCTRQPKFAGQHQNRMRACCLSVLCSALVLVVACTNQNPDQIRQKTAEETAAIKRDTKAVAQGIKEGLSSKRSVDLNKAPKDDLASLPGVTDQQANRIIAERPYANTHQLVTRRILTEDEYSRIQDRVVVSR